MTLQLTYPNINRDPLSLHIARMLEEAIIKQEIMPGDRLIETKISELFNVSRGPVREAMIELESLGLVERTPYKGAVVSHLSEKDIDELKSCRMSVEILAAKLIMRKDAQRDKTLLVLQSILDEMMIHMQNNNHAGFIALDFKFHDELIHQAENSLLEEMWKPISVRLRRYFYFNSRQGYISLQEALRQHTEIIKAIASGDVEKTGELLHSHQCWS